LSGKTVYLEIRGKIDDPEIQAHWERKLAFYQQKPASSYKIIDIKYVAGEPDLESLRSDVLDYLSTI